jgi:hypothetical protein
MTARSNPLSPLDIVDEVLISIFGTVKNGRKGNTRITRRDYFQELEKKLAPLCQSVIDYSNRIHDEILNALCGEVKQVNAEREIGPNFEIEFKNPIGTEATTGGTSCTSSQEPQIEFQDHGDALECRADSSTRARGRNSSKREQACFSIILPTTDDGVNKRGQPQKTSAKVKYFSMKDWKKEQQSSSMLLDDDCSNIIVFNPKGCHGKRQQAAKSTTRTPTLRRSRMAEF